MLSKNPLFEAISLLVPTGPPIIRVLISVLLDAIIMERNMESV
jgi:hypothetical protein